MSVFLSCSDRKCEEIATRKCECVTPECIWCKEHFEEHVKSFPESQHPMKSLTLDLSSEESTLLISAQKQLSTFINSRIQSEIKQRNKSLTYLLQEIKILDTSFQSNIDQFNEIRNQLSGVLQEILHKGIPTESNNDLAIRIHALKASSNFTEENLVRCLTYFASREPVPLETHTLILSELESIKTSLDRLKNCTLNNRHLSATDYGNILENLDSSRSNTLLEIKTIAESLSLAHANITTLQNVPSIVPTRKSVPIKIRPTEKNLIEEWKLPYCIKDNVSIYSIAYSPCGNFLAAGGSDCLVKVWDMNTGRLTHTFRGHSDIVFSVSYSYDGKFIASGAGDDSIKVWNLQKNSEQYHLTDLKFHIAYTVCFSPAENSIVSGDVEGTVRYWSLETQKPMKIMKKHKGAVYAVDISQQGLLVASGGKDKTVRIWTLSTGNVKKLQKLTDEIKSVAFAPNELILASGDQSGKVIVWQISNSSKLVTFDMSGAVHSVCFSVDSTLIAGGSRYGAISIWNSTTGKTFKMINDHTGAVNTLRLTKDFVASGSADSTIKVRSLITSNN